jgi:hypothetical protein
LVVKHDHNAAVVQVVRYGLPLVILIFYISASWSFSYTPDSTFLSLRLAKNIATGGTLETVPAHVYAVPNPFWALLIALGSMLNLDSLAVAKIFGLFFSCLAVMLTYLLASEILRDRFLAFCSALALATSGLLLQVAPAGSALPIALALMLAALFFMLRNDYLLSAFMLGIGTLIFWQSAGGFLLLLVDAWLNSRTSQHRVRVLVLSTLMYFCAVVPWLLYIAILSSPPLPWLMGLDDFPALSLASGIAVGLPALVAAVPAARTMRSVEFDGLTRQSHVLVILWTCWLLACAAIWGWDFYLFALPMIIVYALSGARQFALIPGSVSTYSQALLLTGVLILAHQMAFTYAVKPVMAQTRSDAEELVELAYWIKNGIPDDALISARYPERLAFYSGRPVEVWTTARRPITEYVVSELEELWGYEVVHRASRLEDDQLLPGAGRYAVWRKK